ncbi:MAG: siroheme synthase CysG [Bauldia sp.]
MTTNRKLGVFPAFHKVEGRPVLVVGQGEAAANKLRILAETKAEIVLFAPALDAATGSLLREIGGRWVARLPLAEDFGGAALVFIASGDRANDAALALLARQAGLPVNVVDQPDLCDFYTPSIVNRAPLAIAVGTEGAAPVLARHVRARIEALLAPAFGDLAGLADRLRARVKQAFSAVEARRGFWERFFTGPIAEKVFAGRIDEAEAEARAALVAGGAGVGHVSLVGAGPGAEDLLTLRAQRALQAADVILYDRLVPEAVVAMGRRDAARIDVGKARGGRAIAQEEINAALVRHAQEGKRVVRLKSGDPLIFGRAGEEMAALRAAGVPFDVVPGITAAFAAAAEAEIPLTLRGVASSLVFATGQDADGATLPAWAGLALAGATVVVYMGHAVAAGVTARLLEAGLPSTTPVALIENASRADRRLEVTELGRLPATAAALAASGPVLMIVGEAVAATGVAGAIADLAERAA